MKRIVIVITECQWMESWNDRKLMLAQNNFVLKQFVSPPDMILIKYLFKNRVYHTCTFSDQHEKWAYSLILAGIYKFVHNSSVSELKRGGGNVRTRYTHRLTAIVNCCRLDPSYDTLLCTEPRIPSHSIWASWNDWPRVVIIYMYILLLKVR